MNDADIRCPCFFTFAVSNEFRYQVWGQEPGSLTHGHRRLLTFREVYSVWLIIRKLE
jgi:hypothetical protein